MNEKVSKVLNTIIEKFENNDIPEAIAYSMFPIPNIPSSKWSLLNRLTMFLAGTQDARGFKQWQEVNRCVKKGSKAFHILVPRIKKVEDGETGEETQILKGFICGAVFRFEDTDGQPLLYPQVELPTLPLIERAEQWGVSVKAVPGNYAYYGYYTPTNKQISLATKDECVFFHELAHAAHEKIKGSLEKGQDPLQEIVAELSAQALCRLVGKQPLDTLGNSYKYIETYAEKLNITPYTACLKVLSDTEKVLDLILKEGESCNTQTVREESETATPPA
jgi:hypothetical protein